MEFGASLVLEQQQTLSVNQVQSLNILALTNQELEDFLMNEYLENPLLENTSDKENEMITDMEHLYECGSSFRDQYLDNPEEEERRRNDIRARQEDLLKAHLLAQMDTAAMTAKTREIMEYLIDCLDEKGYFPYDVRELAQSSGYGEADLCQCLSELKELEPVGIFSKDLAECLEKQLRVRGVKDEKLFRLLREYLVELMNGQIGIISRNLKISTVQVKEYIHLIGSLNPRPIMDIQEGENTYVVPDIIVTCHGGQWEVSINDGWMGEYKCSDYYMRMMEESSDPQLQAYFREKLERARFVLNCVEQRRRTIVRIVEAVIRCQADYFEGTGPLRPMQQEDIARELGIHVSTVSRAIKGKYIQYRKSIPLKALFTTGLSEKTGAESVSAEVIRERIRQMIAGEGKKPLSDQRLADRLSEEGIDVSRRAVAKYRMQMNIPDSRQRGLLL